MAKKTKQIQEPTSVAPGNGQGEAAVKMKRDVRLAEGFTAYYSSDTQIETGPWDVRMRFGHITDTDKENQIVHVLHVAEVRMSPQHAKKVWEILTLHLEGYEQRFGKIPMPPKS